MSFFARTSTRRIAMALGGLCALLWCAGCWSPSASRLLPEPYRPETTRSGAWYDALHPAASPAEVPAPEVKPPAEAGQTAAAAAQADDALRAFVRGDRVLIALLGVPTTDKDKIEDIVDDRGCVSLPYIGPVRFEGRSSSEIEAEIERLYVVEEKIYKSINVSVISPDDEFFVRGEVRKEGRFPLTGGMTLTKAIAVAGGFNEFADRKDVKIQRGETSIPYNTARIDAAEERDPPIKRGDMVFVPRRWY